MFFDSLLIYKGLTLVLFVEEPQCYLSRVLAIMRFVGQINVESESLFAPKAR